MASGSIGAELGSQAEHRASTGEILRFTLSHQIGKVPIGVVDVHIDLLEFSLQLVLPISEGFEPVSPFKKRAFFHMRSPMR